MLKKELAELRAVQSGEVGMDGSQMSGGGVTTLQAHINKARGIEPQSRVEAEHERTAHRETLDSLELSEETVRI